jgi:hypothetical protein
MLISVLTLEYVTMPVSAVINGVAYDPHNDAVVMAFPVRGVNPVSGDWKAASWESDGAGGWRARCLVGPGGAVQLSAGSYDAWVKITDNPEVPVRRVGVLEVS